MKLKIYIFLALLFLSSCKKEIPVDITGTWDISFIVTTGTEGSPEYNGEMTLVQDEDNLVTGSINIYDDLNFMAFAELLPGAFIDDKFGIFFESYVWLINDSVSTLTLSYSGTINPPSKIVHGYDSMDGEFKSGETSIGSWSATKK